MPRPRLVCEIGPPLVRPRGQKEWKRWWVGASDDPVEVDSARNEPRPVAHISRLVMDACCVAVAFRLPLLVRGDPLPDLRAVVVAGIRTRRGNFIRGLECAIPPMNAEDQLCEPAASKRALNGTWRKRKSASNRCGRASSAASKADVRPRRQNDSSTPSRMLRASLKTADGLLLWRSCGRVVRGRRACDRVRTRRSTLSDGSLAAFRACRRHF